MKSYNSIKAELDALQKMLPNDPSPRQFGNLLDCKYATLVCAGWTRDRFVLHESFRRTNPQRIIVWFPSFGGSWRNADDLGEVHPQLGDIIIQKQEPRFLPEGLYAKMNQNLIWEVEEE